MYRSRFIATGIMLGVFLTGVGLLLISDQSVADTEQAQANLCEYHGIANNLCTRCNPELIPSFKAKGDWCTEHNLPESQCDLCNPGLSAGATAALATTEDKQSGVVDWCAEHRVPESECTKCHPELIEGFKERNDWCGGHDVPESHCYLCHPQLKFEQEAVYLKSQNKVSESSTIDWCSEHRVPESECTKCHPELIEGFKARNDWCGGHDVPESHCYQCHPQLKFEQETEYKKLHSNERQSHAPNTSLYRTNSAACATDNTVIQLASIDTPSRIGLEVITIAQSPATEIIEVPAKVEFDGTGVSTITCPVSATLAEWIVMPGEDVRRGQILAYVESIEAAAQKAEYAHAAAMLDLARQTLERKQSLDQSGLANARELQEAQADFQRAHADLRRAESILQLLQFSNEEQQAIAAGNAGGSRIPLRSRQDGRLVEQKMELGSVINAGTPVGVISQTERLWVGAWIREEQLSLVKRGQPVTISLDDNGWKACTGKVVWISDGIDPKTQMGMVRIEANQNGTLLRANQYVRIGIETIHNHDAMLIPANAVQWEGCCNVVFEQESPDRYRPRKVKIEFAEGDHYAVSGLTPGIKIVSQGSYMLKTELMKSSIGAGCCGVGA